MKTQVLVWKKVAIPDTRMYLKDLKRLAGVYNVVIAVYYVLSSHVGHLYYGLLYTYWEAKEGQYTYYKRCRRIAI